MRALRDWMIVLGVIGICVLGALLANNGASPSSSLSFETVKATTRFGCLCAPSRDDLGSVLLTYKNSDVSGQYGLLMRGKAIQLEAGTGLDIVVSDDGIDAVLIKSGLNIGRTCYVWDKFLQH